MAEHGQTPEARPAPLTDDSDLDSMADRLTHQVAGVLLWLDGAEAALMADGAHAAGLQAARTAARDAYHLAVTLVGALRRTGTTDRLSRPSQPRHAPNPNRHTAETHPSS